MSEGQQSPTMARADEEEEEEEYLMDDEEQLQGASKQGEDEEEEEEEGLELLELYMQHGARRNWQLRKKHRLHKAKCGLRVASGKELGNIVGSRSSKVWSGLKYYHVELIGGEPLQGGPPQVAPHVRFLPPEDSPETDDPNWLRPVHAKIMAHLQPLWLEAINTKFKDKDEKRNQILAYYKPVLEWKPSQLDGPRLDPVSLGTGPRGFLALKRPLTTIRVAPPVQPRKLPLEGGEANEPKKQKASSVDTESVQDDSPFEAAGEGSGVWRLGEVGRVHTFNGIDGFVYAAVLP